MKSRKSSIQPADKELNNLVSRLSRISAFLDSTIKQPTPFVVGASTAKIFEEALRRQINKK